MSKPATPKSPDGEAADPSGAAPKGRSKRVVLLGLPVLLLGVGAGLWFSGILPPLLGMGGAKAETPAAPHPSASAEATAETKPAAGKPTPGGGAENAATTPIFFELPDIITDLNAPGRRTVYVKLKPRLELARPEDTAAVQAALPRLMDLFQTYLREMRPEELRGSIGTYRLREALLARANIAASPAKIVDVLFAEMIIQ